MPNFDGTGPLKRGRVIGRGRGHCNLRDAGFAHPMDAGEPSPDGEDRAEGRKEE